MCDSRKHMSKSPQVRPHHRHSLRNGFNGLFARSPRRDRTLLSPSSAVCHRRTRHLPLGRRACTPLPSATLPIVEHSKAPGTVASTTSRPAYRDDPRETPLLPGRDGGRYAHITIFGKRIFRTRVSEQRHAPETSHEICSYARTFSHRPGRSMRPDSDQINRTDLPVGANQQASRKTFSSS
jgi:hypothetical protein